MYNSDLKAKSNSSGNKTYIYNNNFVIKNKKTENTQSKVLKNLRP